MYKELIKHWLPNLTPKIILDYAKSINIPLTTNDANILYQFIMKNYSEILDGNETSFKELQKEINPTLYNQVINLYKEQKNKYL